MSETDDVEGFNPRLLIGATGWTLAELVNHIHGLGGLAIAAHIDREAFSVISQLGFVDPEIPFDALEISRRTGIAAARGIFADLAPYPFLISSDAHRLDDIGGGMTELRLEAVSIRELKLALAGREGRGIAGY